VTPLSLHLVTDSITSSGFNIAWNAGTPSFGTDSSKHVSFYSICKQPLGGGSCGIVATQADTITTAFTGLL
jgi:hypothetical protein